jgi:outer membrane receptor protein involved in Fe transport
MNNTSRIFLQTLAIIIVSANLCLSQTTGKIAGIIEDETTGEPLAGVNVYIEGTNMGGSTDLDGAFFIINIPPGTYDVTVQMIGYKNLSFPNVRVSTNSTITLNGRLEPSIMEGETIVVEVDKIAAKKDQTGSALTVSSDQMQLLPVESLEDVVSIQSGVVAGHFRGGRDTEVSYMIDGLQVDENFSGTGSSVTIETESVEDLEVIKGTFNAEYGRAMSGVVNAVTKEGRDRFQGSVQAHMSNYFTSHSDVFPGLTDGSLDRNLSQDYKIQFSGPILGDNITFFTNYRRQILNGYLNGIRRFNATDYSDYTSSDPDQWHIENSGDDELVSMMKGYHHSFLGKITFRPINVLKVSAMLTFNDDETKAYNHYYKYNPDYLGSDFHRSYMYTLTLNHTITPAFFYELKASYVDNKYDTYKYEDPLDSRYVHPRYVGTGQSGFATGGVAAPGKSMSYFDDYNLKVDLSWQVTNNHLLKGGGLFTQHYINQDRIDVRNKYAGLPQENIRVVDPVSGKIDWPFYELELVPKTENTIDVYEVQPFEFSGYLQDKMEFEDMVINLGVRYDYFYSDQVYPTDRRNPSNQLNLPDSMMTSYSKADPQTQISPRFGLSYQLGSRAVLHFSYGHFFQMPPMYALYANNIFRVPVNDFGTTMGNAQLHPQKTIQYEIGLWQELIKGLGLEVSLYYKDIYDLLSTRVISTYNQIEYGLYTNKDYGNARGLEMRIDFDRGGLYSFVNYTLAFTKGNADNPTQTFTRAGSSMDPIKRLIPMSWDQRHTFNITVGYSTPKYVATLMAFYDTGTPYTFSPQTESPLSLINLYQNNDYMPSSFRVDLNAYYAFDLFSDFRAKLYLRIYNLLDRKNPIWVYGDTGQPYTTVVRESQIAQHRSDFNDYYDRVENPTAFAAPREIKLGIGVEF